MARIRTIKPSFFKDEELAELPLSARMLFIGLWCLADKEGRLQDRPKRIKAEIFPYDSVEVDQQLSRLQSAGFISRYEVGEMKVIQIINFSKHQRITGTEATSESDLPPVPDGINEETIRKQQGNKLDDWKGKEGKGYKERKGDGISTREKIEETDLVSPKNKKEKEKIAPGAEISMPFGADFSRLWDQWKIYKRDQFSFKYKGIQSEQAALNDLVSKAKGVEEVAVRIIHQSMAQGWKGFFELKDTKNGTTTNKPTGAGIETSSILRRINAMPD